MKCQPWRWRASRRDMEVMVNSSSQFSFANLRVSASRERIGVIRNIRERSRIANEKNLLEECARERRREREKERWNTLTFSFALPACFCTVFAINAPLLSAMMIPERRLWSARIPKTRVALKTLLIRRRGGPLAALRKGGEAAARRLVQNDTHVRKRGDTLRARRRVNQRDPMRSCDGTQRHRALRKHKQVHKSSYFHMIIRRNLKLTRLFCEVYEFFF